LTEAADARSSRSVVLRTEDEYNVDAGSKVEAGQEIQSRPHIDFSRTNRIIVTPSEPVRHDSGSRLRTLREQLALTMRDVESASIRLAEKHRNEEFIVPLSRLSDFETKGIIPSLFRLYALQ
jgi:hypothetical protein